MGALARGTEVVVGVVGGLLSFIPFAGNLVRSVCGAAAAERRRVRDALGRWDGPPEPAPPPGAPRSGRVFVVAGEPSGDRLLAGVVAALRERHPAVSVRGYAGHLTAAAGAALDHDLADDAVMGVTAVLRAAPRFIGLFARFLRILDEERPDVLLLVDYPGFNQRAAEAARRRGIPVVWYVVPQIWAWAPWRARRIGRAVDDLLVVLPFERAFYADRGVTAAYVGYPVFEEREREAPDADLARRLTAEDGPVLAVLPGSRRQEVRDNLPALLAAVRRVREARPAVRPVIACAAPRLRPAIDAAVTAAGVEVTVVDGHARTVLSVARAAACVSGTITMECVHAAVPAVVVYQISALKRRAMRWVVTAPFIALANLLAGRAVFPEFTAPATHADAVAAALVERLDDGDCRTTTIADLEALRARLASTGIAARTAAVLEAHLPGR